jgi:hypothetical protein
MQSNYLTEEEQYKSILNRDEVERIKDPRLREIRSRYLAQTIEVLNAGHSMSDVELINQLKPIELAEQAEIEKYKQMIAEKDTLE